jgi:hypothetical protein
MICCLLFAPIIQYALSTQGALTRQSSSCARGAETPNQLRQFKTTTTSFLQNVIAILSTSPCAPLGAVQDIVKNAFSSHCTKSAYLVGSSDTVPNALSSDRTTGDRSIATLRSETDQMSTCCHFLLPGLAVDALSCRKLFSFLPFIQFNPSSPKLSHSSSLIHRILSLVVLCQDRSLLHCMSVCRLCIRLFTLHSLFYAL